MRTRLVRVNDQSFAPYALAAAIVAGSFLLRLCIEKVLGVQLVPFISVYPAVMLAALLTGFWPGVFATLLATGLAVYWIFPPFGSLAIASRSQGVSVAVFAAMGILMSMVAEWGRRGKQAEIDTELAVLRLEEAQRIGQIGDWDWVFASDAISWSPQVYAILGRDPSLGPPASYQEQTAYYEPASVALINVKIAEAIATGETQQYEFVVLRPDGTRVLTQAIAIPRKDKDGRVVGLHGTLQDITERKHAQDQLRRNEAIHSQLLDAMDEGLCVIQMMFDPENRPVDWLFLEVNGTFEKQSGLHDVVGKRLRELSPNHKQFWLDFQGNVALTGEPGYIYDSQGLNGFYEVHAYRVGEPALRQVAVLFNDVTERKRQEAALRESEGKLRKVIDGLGPDMFVGLMTTDGVLIEANVPALEAAGLTQEDVLGRPFADTYWWAYSEAAQEQLIGAIKRAVAGVPARYDVQLRVAEATLIWVDFSLFPIRDSAGEVIFLVPSANIIDERKKAEENVLKLNRTYAMLSDINQTIVRQKDSGALLEAACRIAVDKGKFQMAWVGMVDQASLQFRPVASYGNLDGYLDTVGIDLKDERHSNGPAVRCVLTGRHSVCNDIDADPDYVPWRDEALRRGYRSSAGLPLTVDGRVIGSLNLYASEPAFFGVEELVLLDEIAMDIAFALEVNQHEKERRKAEDELRWRTAFFEGLVESALDGIMVVDHWGKVILQNKRIYDLWKIPAGVSEAKDDSKQIEFVASAMRNPDQFVERVNYLYSHPEEVGQDEVELLDGTILERYSSPVRDKTGAYYGRIWFFHDITKRRRLEEQFRQSQKMDVVGQLTGGIAHDFNNLLGIILGNLELLEYLVPENEVALKRIRTAQKASERGADLTRRMLAFSSNLELKPSPTDLHHCVRNMLELSGVIGRDLKFNTHFDDSIPLVLVDASGFESALLNLVVNARDAMPNGGVITISTLLARVEDDYPPVQAGELKAGLYACISVSDTGHGMSKKTLDRVFEPFFTTKPEGKGTGLGLAMVYGFVKQSGGSIRIYSEPDVGTSVTFYLPLAESLAQSLAGSVPSPSPITPGRKALVVDDEPGLLEIAATYLKRMGFTVYEAEDGASAMEVVRQHNHIDLLITDIIMPGGMNGVELAQKLRQLLPEIKIVYTSGFAANTLAERSMPLLYGELLRKPYQRADFETAIHMALR